MKCEKVRVEIKRPYPDVICGRVLEMPEKFRGKHTVRMFGNFDVASDTHPMITADSLWLHGSNKAADNSTMFHQFNSPVEADAWLNAMRSMIREINQELEAEGKEAAPSAEIPVEILE